MTEGDVVSIPLQYGEGELRVKFEASGTQVVLPKHRDGASDPLAVVRAAIRTPVAGPPLRELVKSGQRVAISCCDITRPQPRALMITAILEELEGIVSRDDVTILLATGTHRGHTDAELRSMFGDSIVETVRIVDHNARDESSLTFVGQFGAAVPVWLNTEWVKADFKITTGFVEPHFFAGFSGGPKLVAPGLAGIETVRVLHDANRIGDPKATWGVTYGNPVHDDVRAIAAATGVDFALDVVLNRRKEIVAAFGGEILAMHKSAASFARDIAMQPVDDYFDVVVTTNSGFPLDQNLYQSVKGISAAYRVLKPGGVIVCAAECRDGFPDHGSYREVLTSGASPAELLSDIENRSETVPDQWQVQIQARIQTSARVVMHTSYLSDADLASAHLEQTNDIERTVQDALQAAGPNARLCVLPEGPQVIPFVRERA